MNEEPKNRMFQYATKHQVIEDTGLITQKEAQELWEKYQSDIKDRWGDLESPQMCIWKDCETNTSYHTEEKEIDFRDCELRNGRFYKLARIE